jgi:hypothetical protein
MFGWSYKLRIQSHISEFNNLTKYLKLGHLELCVSYLNIYWIFHGLNPFGRTMAVGSTQPQREVSTRNISRLLKAADTKG